MSTALQIASDAMRKINIIGQGESADGDELLSVVRALTLMVSSWKAKGVNVDVTATVAPWHASTAYALGDQRANDGGVYTCIYPGVSASSGGPSGRGSAIADGSAQWAYSGSEGPIDPSLEQAVIDLLAVRIAPSFGITVAPEVIQQAAEGWSAILAFYVQAPQADTDTALKRVGARYGGILA
jgi:hypothetical protein